MYICILHVTPCDRWQSKPIKYLYKCLKAPFTTPVRDRCRLEKNAIILFWRRKSGLSFQKMQGRDVLFYEGKKVLINENRKWKGPSVKQKGGGARSSDSIKAKICSLSEALVRNVMESSRQHGQTQAYFTNKPQLKTVSSRSVFERVQVDLLRLKDVEFQGQTNTFCR